MNIANNSINHHPSPVLFSKTSELVGIAKKASIKNKKVGEIGELCVSAFKTIRKGLELPTYGIVEKFRQHVLRQKVNLTPAEAALAHKIAACTTELQNKVKQFEALSSANLEIDQAKHPAIERNIESSVNGIVKEWEQNFADLKALSEALKGTRLDKRTSVVKDLKNAVIDLSFKISKLSENKIALVGVDDQIAKSHAAQPPPSISLASWKDYNTKIDKLTNIEKLCDEMISKGEQGWDVVKQAASERKTAIKAVAAEFEAANKDTLISLLQENYNNKLADFDGKSDKEKIALRPDLKNMQKSLRALVRGKNDFKTSLEATIAAVEHLEIRPAKKEFEALEKKTNEIAHRKGAINNSKKRRALRAKLAGLAEDLKKIEKTANNDRGDEWRELGESAQQTLGVVQKLMLQIDLKEAKSSVVLVDTAADFKGGLHINQPRLQEVREIMCRTDQIQLISDVARASVLTSNDETLYSILKGDKRPDTDAAKKECIVKLARSNRLTDVQMHNFGKVMSQALVEDVDANLQKMVNISEIDRQIAGSFSTISREGDMIKYSFTLLVSINDGDGYIAIKREISVPVAEIPQRTEGLVPTEILKNASVVDSYSAFCPTAEGGAQAAMQAVLPNVSLS